MEYIETMYLVHYDKGDFYLNLHQSGTILKRLQYTESIFLLHMHSNRHYINTV